MRVHACACVCVCVYFVNEWAGQTKTAGAVQRMCKHSPTTKSYVKKERMQIYIHFIYELSPQELQASDGLQHSTSPITQS